MEVGNDCAKKIQDATMLGQLPGHGHLHPDLRQRLHDAERHRRQRITSSGSPPFWLDYISYSNNPNNSDCARTTSPNFGTTMINIVGGNGSASCMAGWFVRYVTSGPVGSGAIFDGEAIGVQLVR